MNQLCAPCFFHWHFHNHIYLRVNTLTIIHTHSQQEGTICITASVGTAVAKKKKKTASKTASNKTGVRNNFNILSGTCSTLFDSVKSWKVLCLTHLCFKYISSLIRCILKDNVLCCHQLYFVVAVHCSSVKRLFFYYFWACMHCPAHFSELWPSCVSLLFLPIKTEHFPFYKQKQHTELVCLPAAFKNPTERFSLWQLSDLEFFVFCEDSLQWETVKDHFVWSCTV